MATGLGIQELKICLVDIALTHPQIGVKNIKVSDTLLALQTHLQKLVQQNRVTDTESELNTHYLNWAEFESLCLSFHILKFSVGLLLLLLVLFLSITVEKFFLLFQIDPYRKSACICISTARHGRDCMARCSYCQRNSMLLAIGPPLCVLGQLKSHSARPTMCISRTLFESIVF